MGGKKAKGREEKKIREAKYNRWYKVVTEDQVLGCQRRKERRKVEENSKI